MSLCDLEPSTGQTMSHTLDLTQDTISGPCTFLFRGRLPSFTIVGVLERTVHRSG
jgi:hypothetical protein